MSSDEKPVRYLLRTLPLFAYHAVWRVTGLRRAGRALVRALGSESESVRTIAGMMLVHAGKKSEPLLEEALERRENLPPVLILLGDLDDRTVEQEIRRLSQDSDPTVARAARDTLRLFDSRQATAR